MSIGPVGGILGSAAGAPLAQTKGSESERSRVEGNARQRETDSQIKTEAASGVGKTDSDEGASDRDADGRKLYEDSPEAETANEEPSPDQPASAAKANGRGGKLDLLG